MNKLLQFTLLLIPFLISCEGKNESIPAYIHVNTVDFKYENVSTLGNGGTAITDVWVYSNDDLLGVFELPATIAVAAAGTHKITLAGGIKLNGISATRERYPFYERWNSTVDLKPLDTAYLAPVVQYYKETGISFYENFENVVTTIDTTSSSDVALVRTQVINQPKYLDRYVGLATLDANHKGFKAYNTDFFIPPVTSSLPIYLELDYKCNQEFVVSAIIIQPGQPAQEFPIISLRSTEKDGKIEWRHIYVDLTDYYLGQTNATGFGFSFTAYYNSGNTEGLIYLDNPKVVNSK